jgi:uncharacterized protein (TIGR00369 family)
VNPDRALALEFLRSGGQPLAMTSNPLARDLSGSIRALDAARGTALLAFEPPQQFLQGAQVLQGGALAIMLDFAMAFAAHARLEPQEKPFATASLTVHFLRPASAPARYLAHGRIVHLGTRLIYADAHLEREDDARRVAAASAVMAIVGSQELGAL